MHINAEAGWPTTEHHGAWYKLFYARRALDLNLLPTIHVGLTLLAS